MGKLQNHHTIGGALAAHHAITRNAGNSDDILIGINNGLYTVKYAFRVSEVRAGRAGDVDHEHTLIFLWHQALWKHLHEEYKEHTGDSEGDGSHPAVIDSTTQGTGVFVHHGTERGLIGHASALVQSDEESVDAVTCLTVLLGRTHHHRTEGGADDEGRNARDADSRGQRDAELGVEHTTGSTHHCDGDEHCHEDEGTRDNGHGDVTHGVLCSLITGSVSSIELRLYRLNNDDGIIHHGTDGEHQGKERKQVQSEACGGQGGKGADEGYDDGNRGNQSGSEIL